MKKIESVIRNKFFRLSVAALVWGMVLLTVGAEFKPTLSHSAPVVDERTILPPPTITVFPTGSSDSSEGGQPRVIYVQRKDLWPWDEGQHICVPDH